MSRNQGGHRHCSEGHHGHNRVPEHSHDCDHGDDHGHEPGHGHGVIDPSMTTTERGIWAVKWSFIGLMVTALIQVIVVVRSGSVALLADTIHNFGDASTAIPLWIAFLLARWKPTKRFTYGYGRVEDLAGLLIVFTILFSAIIAGYQAIDRLIHPRAIGYLGEIAVVSLIGFLGNEAVAVFRINIGREISSAALVADGYHARVDGWTSLSVLVGALGVWLGYPIADPIVGLLITAAILVIVWQSAKAVFTRLLDGVEPEVIQDIKQVAHHVAGVRKVSEVHARWFGHRLHTEVNIAVEPAIPIAKAHEIAKEVYHQLLHRLQYLSRATIHVDPVEEAGEQYHRIASHCHDGLPAHSH